MSSLRHPGPPPSVPPPPTPSEVPRRPRSQWPSRPQSQEIKDAAVWPVKASSFPPSISAAAQPPQAARPLGLDAPLRPGSKPADIAKRSSLSVLSLNRSKPLPEKPPPMPVSRPSKRSSRPSSRNGAAAPRRADTVPVHVQRKPSDSARPSSARNQHALQKKRSFFRRVADRLTRSRSTLRDDAKRQAETANGHSVASPTEDEDAPPPLLTETTQPAPSAPLSPVPSEPEPQPPTPKSARKQRPPSIKVSHPQPLVSSARRSPPGDMTVVTRSRASSDQPRSTRASSERSPTSPTLLTPAHNVPLPLSPTSPLPDPDTFPLPPPPSPRRARPRPRLSPVPSRESSSPHIPQPPSPSQQQQQQQLQEQERRLSTARVSTWLAGPTKASGDDELDGPEELWRAAMRAEEEDVVLPEVERMALEAEERVRVRARSNTTGRTGVGAGAGKDKVKEARRSMSLFKRGSKALGLEYAITRTPTSASKQASPPTQPSSTSLSSLPPSALHPPSSPTSPRAPLSPTMHTHGSILLETKDIADPESRRLSEMVFLS